MKHVFISHSTEDREIADRLSQDLAKRGYRIIAYQDALPGAPVGSRISRAIREAEYALILVSPLYVQSPRSRTELQSLSIAESDGGIRIIPILVADTKFPSFLRDREFADFRQGYETVLERVTRALVSVPEHPELTRARWHKLWAGIGSLIVSIMGALLSSVITLMRRRDLSLIRMLSENTETIFIVFSLVAGLTGFVAGIYSLYNRLRHRSAREEVLIRSLERVYLERLDNSNYNPVSSGK